ncbi:protein phosphatase 1 regulatory subunit 15B [Anoplopoma fimbria]|uniref:protein phosphatase 1 regulatory subunit 15B n=1 Tax=Anoplopoma fimbria TaxID=229290 RepID=UPI0023EA9A71|nr:protein phosphatase 1 regulatory subunit 15B [Anoplopoma fimbria]
MSGRHDAAHPAPGAAHDLPAVSARRPPGARRRQRLAVAHRGFSAGDGDPNPEDIDLNLCQQTQMGYLSSVRTFFSHVLLSSVSSQEIKPPGQSRTWWGNLWVGEEGSHKGTWSEAPPVTGRLCPGETKAPETTDAWTLGEHAGPTDLKEPPANNGGLQTAQNRRLSVGERLSGSGAAAACSEVALLTPDQDNGYSSLEEELFQVRMLEAPSEAQREADSDETSAAVETEMEDEIPEEGESTSGKVDDDEEEQQEEEEEAEAESEEAPQCQNKAIAFIMGCPCSDEDDSQSDGESSDEDDDGFDSEGSSDESDSTDEDDEEEDEEEEEDSEAERLWSSLCQSVDPYNPETSPPGCTPPPRPGPSPPPRRCPPPSPRRTPPRPSLPLAASSSSPPSGSDFWDDSTSASEADEAESLRLWSSFSCPADPYSPLNFQASLRTQRPVEEAGPRTRTRTKKASQTPSRSLYHNPASPPEYRKEEAEERLDSGFSEPSTSSSTSSSTQSCKKVRFCDVVEEFFASCGEEEEDRRGPWEELARDRCRFLRRCQEVEHSIAYCLQPQHRGLVYRRLVSVLYVQDA